MLDPSTGSRLWQGWAQETLLNRLDAEDEIRAAVASILEAFPRSRSMVR